MGVERIGCYLVDAVLVGAAILASKANFSSVSFRVHCTPQPFVLEREKLICGTNWFGPVLSKESLSA